MYTTFKILYCRSKFLPRRPVTRGASQRRPVTRGASQRAPVASARHAQRRCVELLHLLEEVVELALFRVVEERAQVPLAEAGQKRPVARDLREDRPVVPAAQGGDTC